MSCLNQNLLVNGGFRRGVAPWTGRGFKRVKNPVYSGDSSILMSKGSVLKQVLRGRFESECAYYLYYRLLGVSQKSVMYATVAYYDQKGRLIRSTPLLIRVPQAEKLRFSPYFVIVPPPPKSTQSIAVVFLCHKGKVFIDYIRFASHTITGR